MGAESDKPYARDGGGIRLAVRVVPRAGRDTLDGVVRDAAGRPLLRVRLNAPPVDGAANAALIGFLAEALGLRKADVTIRSGQASRTKMLALAGDGTVILARLEALVGA
jgi:uncharacterized protein (TIGR00251 family)